jgi:dipeptidyl aminopeptidase/acylaminoacyl peptidase
LKTEKKIASNSPLLWIDNGKAIVVALREEGWADSSRVMFEEATVGPITVYDSRKPFLKWDEIRGMSSLQVIARVDLDNREVLELLPEGRYGSLRFSKGTELFSYLRTFPLKTSYNRRGGSEYELLALEVGADTSRARVLRARSDRRLNVSWNEENTKLAWADSGFIFVQSIDEEKPKNLTRDLVLDEEDSSKVEFSMNRWSPDGSKLLVSSKKGYWLLDEAGAEIELVYEFPEDREKAPNRNINAWSPDSRYLYMTYSAKDKWERGFSRLDISTGQVEDLLKDSNLYSGWRMTKDGETFFFNFSDGDTPSNLYKIDNNFRNRIQLTELNSWVKDKKLTRSELIKYLDTDGNELFGILYYPVDYDPDKQYPLVCEIYETFFNNGFNSNMNIIAGAGFFGFRPSVKLNTGYPGEAWIKGITSGINKLIDRGLVDPKKLGVHGTSYGGYAASLLITQTDRFAAAINISGKTNIISFLGESPRIGTRNYSAAEVGQDRIGATLWEAPMKYINHSAVMFADRVTTPHLILTGEGDWNVPAASSREMYYALRRLGKECVWVNYVNGGHGAGRASNEAEYFDQWRRIIDWYTTFFEKADEDEKNTTNNPEE